MPNDDVNDTDETAPDDDRLNLPHEDWEEAMQEFVEKETENDDTDRESEPDES